MSATVRDIAQQAGVSPATVSLVLNRRPGVGEDTRKLVLGIADELAYTPPAVKRRKKSPAIRLLKIARHGHIINRDHNVFISDYIDGIEREARENGYTLEIRSYNSFDADSLIEELNSCEIGGAVVLATELMTGDIPLFQEAEIPLVFIDGTHPFAPFDFIDMDNEGAVFSIVSHFIDAGHKEIGIVTSSVETRNFKAREEAFNAALEFHGLKADPNMIFTVDSTFEQAFLDMEKLLDKRKRLPGALFCVSDIIAYGCLKALKNHGINVPGQVSLMGFDNLPSSAMTEPPLSSVNVSKSRIGRRAFQMLKRRMEANDILPYEKVFIASEIIERNSVLKL